MKKKPLITPKNIRESFEICASADVIVSVRKSRKKNCNIMLPMHKWGKV